MRHVVGGRASQPEKQAASISEVGRFETEMLSTKADIKKLMDLSGEWIDRVHQRKPPKKLILDMDGSVSETYTASKKDQRTMGTSSASAILRCSCSIKMATWNGPCYGEVITPARSTGGGCCCRWLHATVIWTYTSCFEVMRPSPLQRCTDCRRRKAFSTPSVFRPMTCWNWKSPVYSRVRWAVLRESQSCCMPAFCTALPVGVSIAAWWPRSSGTRSYVTFRLAEVAVPRKLFRAILRRIAKFRLPQPWGSPT